MHELLPDNTDPGFVELIDVYRHTDIEFPKLKGITMAQWALESGWGLSDLAMQHNNFAGMKWRAGMADYGTAIRYSDWQGRSDPYVSFRDKAAFIAGYWKRLDLVSAYNGWRLHTETPEKFITFIGPIWLGMSHAQNVRYINNVLRIHRQRMKPVIEG